MADFLALSWDRRRLCGLEFSAAGAGPRVLGGFSVEWPEQPPTSEWLRETLRRFGINARQVILALPREDAVLRLLELPNVSDDELPTLVRFQAAARSAQALEQLLLDFLPLPLRTGVAQKEVWLATALLTTVDPIRKLLVDAGLDLVRLTLSSFCLAEMIARLEARKSLDASGASLVVLRQGARMELAVVCQRQLIAAHAVKWPSVNEIPPVAKMLAEVSRVLVQVQAWLPGGTLQRAWVIGTDVDIGELPAAIHQRWKCPAELFDPWTDGQNTLPTKPPEGHAADYAIAVGLALIQVGATTPKLDLLHPRQQPHKRDPWKPIIAAGSAAALLAAAMSAAVITQSLANYDARIELLRTEDNEQGQRVKEGEPVLEAAKSVEDWQARNINQLKQMNELYQLMHGTQRVVISDYKFGPGLGNVLAKLKATGNARDRGDAEQLAQSFADTPKFNVAPSSVTATSRDPEYASRFDLDVELVAVKSRPAKANVPGSTKNPVPPKTTP